MNQVDLTYKIVQGAFKDKYDKGNRPYIEHLERVAANFKRGTEAWQVAMLHDLFEDCPAWSPSRLMIYCSDAVVNAVVEHTKKPRKSYADYICKVKENVVAKEVKIADPKDNMDITRLVTITDEDMARLKKYHWAYIS